MYVNDPIADMLTRIRNALNAGHTSVSIPYSKLKEELARVLLEEGYIERYQIREASPVNRSTSVKIRRFAAAAPAVITGLKRVSKPGRRIYAGYRDIPWVLSGMGVAILTTPRGLMTDQQARRERVGGEVLCFVW